MGEPALIVGARASPLSRAQVEEVLPALQRVLPERCVRKRLLEALGDRDLLTPLDAGAAPTDFFTRELDQLLLSGEVDLCVHSAKDLPSPLPEGLALAALRPAADLRDTLVFGHGFGPARPPRVVGTSSPGRRANLRGLYPGAEMKSIRGTIQSRLEQLDAGAFDAVVVAASALDRLGLSGRIGEYLPFDPAPQQGRLALVVRSSDTRLLRALRPLDVRRTAGWVVLARPGGGGIGALAAFPDYLCQADLVLADPGTAESLCARGARQVMEIASAPPVELHRRLLAEAESGRFVLRVSRDDPAPASAFLRDWNIRCGLYDDSGFRIPPGGDATLFTGTDPSLFLRHGPFLWCPVITLEREPLAERVCALREGLGGADGVVFPSRFAVETFVEALDAGGLRGGVSRLRLLAVGPMTAAAMEAAGLLVAAAPRDFGGVASLVRDADAQWKGRYLYPCSDASPAASRVASLRPRGIELVPVRFYRNRPVQNPRLPELPFSRVFFTSGSTVRAFFDAFPAERERRRLWLAVGPSTLAAMEALGLEGEMIHATE